MQLRFKLPFKNIKDCCGAIVFSAKYQAIQVELPLVCKLG